MNPDDDHLKLVARAIRLSAHILKFRPEELPSQLQGRLQEFSAGRLRSFLGQIESETTWSWMKSYWPSYHSPSSPLIQTFVGHNDEVTALSPTANGRVISASADHTLRLWCLNTGACEQVFRGHTDRVTVLALTGDGRVVSGSDDTTLCVWCIDTGACEQVFEGHTGEVTSIALTANGRVISASADPRCVCGV